MCAWFVCYAVATSPGSYTDNSVGKSEQIAVE